MGALQTLSLGASYDSHFARVVLHTRPSSSYVVLHHAMAFPTHSIGLPAIVAVPVAIFHSVISANVTLILVLSALAVWIAIEVGRLTRHRSEWTVAIALLFLTPSYLLASTQIYPDLISGMVLAVIIVRIARLERERHATRSQLVVTSVLIGLFPWLHNKNVAVAVVLVLGLALITRRSGLPDSSLWPATAPALVGLAALVVFNIVFYGHPLGVLQPLTLFSSATFVKALALGFDRRHGLFIQTPAALVGVAGLWVGRRRFTMTALLTIVVVAMVVVANASISSGMNGASFVGRYEWEVLPLALAFAGLYLSDLMSAHRRRANVVVAAIVVLSLVQWGYLLSARADASTFYVNGGWAPSTYVGWWGQFDPSPILRYLSGQWFNQRNAWALACVVLVSTTIVVTLVRWLRAGPALRARTVWLLVVAIAVTWSLALTSAPLAPVPRTYAASDLGPPPLPARPTSVTVTGSSAPGRVIHGPNLQVHPGVLRVTVSYDLRDRSASAASATVTLTPSRGGSSTLSKANLDPSSSQRETVLDVVVRSAGLLNVAVFWRGSGRLTVYWVSIARTTTCEDVHCLS